MALQAARGCAARPCERSAELASGRRSSITGSSCNCPVPGDHHLGLGQQHRMGRIAYALREPNSARRSKLRCPMRTQVGVIKQVGIFRLPASSEPALAKGHAFLSSGRQRRRTAATRGRRLSHGRTRRCPRWRGRIGGGGCWRRGSIDRLESHESVAATDAARVPEFERDHKKGNPSSC